MRRNWLAVLVCAAASYLMDGTVAVARAIQEQSENAVMLWTNAFLALTWAPIVETALMAVLIIVLLRMKMNRYVVILICAALAAAAHEMLMPGAGRLVFVGFAIFSYVFITRNKKYGDGFIVVAMTHFFYNLVAVANLFIEHYVS